MSGFERIAIVGHSDEVAVKVRARCEGTADRVSLSSPVAADPAGAELLNRTPDDLPFIAKAERVGAGTADYRSLDLKEIQTS